MTQKFEKIWKEIVRKGWKDPSFKKRLFQKPKQVLKEYGILVPKGIKVKVVEETDKKVYFSLPSKPKLSAKQLKKIDVGSAHLFYSAVKSWIQWSLLKPLPAEAKELPSFRRHKESQEGVGKIDLSVERFPEQL